MATSKFTGTSGNDVILGTIGDDWVNAGAGKDRINLLDGNDTVVFTNDVTDAISKGAGILTLDFSGIGTALNINLVSGKTWRNGTVNLVAETKVALTDVNVIGTSGNDTLSALGHVRGVTFDGGSGNDTLVGGNGDDVLIGGEGNDTISIGLGNDRIELGSGTNSLLVNTGLTSQKIVLDLGAGTAKIWNNVTDFSKGLDAKFNTTISGDLSEVTLYRAVEVTGTDGEDNIRILGGTGHVLNLGGGNDFVVTKLAGITANGGAGDDYFDGSFGDTATAVGLTSTFNGGEGNDTFLLRNDKAFGGDGADTFEGTGTVEGGKGNDTFAGGAMTITYSDSQGIVYNGTGSEQKFLVMEFGDTARVFDKYTSTEDGIWSNAGDGVVKLVPFDRSVAASSISHVVDGETYTDTLGGAVNTVTGTESQDIFLGGKVATIKGLGGDDYFHLFGTELGSGSATRLAYGGNGNDTFVFEDGFKGNVYGEAGQDLFHARAGSSVSAWGGKDGDAFYFETDGGKGNVTNFAVRDFVTDVDVLYIDRDFADSYAALMKMKVVGGTGYTTFADVDGDRLTVYGKFDANDLGFTF